MNITLALARVLCFLTVLQLFIGCASAPPAQPETILVQYEAPIAKSNYSTGSFESTKATGKPVTQVSVASDATYHVELRDDRMIFLGIDQPWVIDPRPGDTFEQDKGGNLYNTSSWNRANEEANQACDQLRPLVRTADTATLLNSLRASPGGRTDYCVALAGNRLIATEIAKRMPIDIELHKWFDQFAQFVFVGISGPPIVSLRDYLEAVVALE